MELKCYLCDKIFPDISDIIKHLKKIHFVRENINEICCLTPKCDKNFDTFNALRQHTKKCSDVMKRKIIKKSVVKEVRKYDIYSLFSIFSTFYIFNLMSSFFSSYFHTLNLIH